MAAQPSPSAFAVKVRQLRAKPRDKNRLENTMDTDADQSTNFADAQDVWNIYNLTVRRDPENKTVIQARLGQAIKDVFTEFLCSREFSNYVLPALISKTTDLLAYRGTMSFGHLLVWAHARLPVRSELRERLLHARSWAELDEMLFLDSELRHLFPQLNDAGL
jgi:hypothetical protein